MVQSECQSRPVIWRRTNSLTFLSVHFSTLQAIRYTPHFRIKVSVPWFPKQAPSCILVETIFAAQNLLRHEEVFFQSWAKKIPPPFKNGLEIDFQWRYEIFQLPIFFLDSSWSVWHQIQLLPLSGFNFIEWLQIGHRLSTISTQAHGIGLNCCLAFFSGHSFLYRDLHLSNRLLPLIGSKLPLADT